jgi:hypothetical protein
MKKLSKTSALISLRASVSFEKKHNKVENSVKALT